MDAAKADVAAGQAALSKEVTAIKTDSAAALTEIKSLLGLTHAAALAAATKAVAAAPVVPVPVVPVASATPVHVGLTSDDPNEIVVLSPAAALINGQQANGNTHYWAYLKSLTPDQLAAWCVAFLTQSAAAVNQSDPSHGVVTVSGMQYPVNNVAQGIIINLAINWGRGFPFRDQATVVSVGARADLRRRRRTGTRA